MLCLSWSADHLSVHYFNRYGLNSFLQVLAYWQGEPSGGLDQDTHQLLGWCLARLVDLHLREGRSADAMRAYQQVSH